MKVDQLEVDHRSGHSSTATIYVSNKSVVSGYASTSIHPPLWKDIQKGGALQTSGGEGTRSWGGVETHLPCIFLFSLTIVPCTWITRLKKGWWGEGWELDLEDKWKVFGSHTISFALFSLFYFLLFLHFFFQKYAEFMKPVCTCVTTVQQC